MDRTKKPVIITPYIKWIGGKRQIQNQIISMFPKDINTFYEPFFGGGAIFWNLKPKKAVIGDINKELYISLNTIKNQLNELIKQLELFEKNNSKEFYLKIRSKTFDEDVKIAARFIYMNKAGFNGMYRLNSFGKNNVPFSGKKVVKTFNLSNLQNINKFLNENKIEILNNDYFKIIKNIKQGDLAYFDPPYDVEINNFTKYTKLGFDRAQQERLANILDDLDFKKIKWVLSNSATDWVLKRYNKYEITKITTNRLINSVAKKRINSGKEVIIKNF